KIYLEYLRTSHSSPPVSLTPRFEEEDYQRLDRFLEQLSAADRFLIMEYYRGDGQQKIANSKRLAVVLGIPINALRIRAHRIRATLQSSMLGERISTGSNPGNDRKAEDKSRCDEKRIEHNNRASCVGLNLVGQE